MKYIYALTDPRDQCVRYVGQTNDIGRRYSQHNSTIESTPKGLWIQELHSLDLKPGIAVLATAETQEEINYLETWWILLGRRAGWNLRNGTNPGAWRVKEDFRALFADELARMYEEHKAACERLQAEVIALAVERERLKWLSRTWYMVYGVNALFVAIGIVYLSVGIWAEVPADSPLGPGEIFWGRLTFVLMWTMQFLIIYLHRATKEEEYQRADWWFVQAAYATWSCFIIGFGAISLFSLIQKWGAI